MLGQPSGSDRFIDRFCGVFDLKCTLCRLI